jgi:hypothetical protein
MQVNVIDHPLISHKLTLLRDENTDSPTFRRLVDELVTLLTYEATRDVRVEPVDVKTPVTTASGVRLTDPRPLVVPILRAGLGMLEGMQRLRRLVFGAFDDKAGAVGSLWDVVRDRRLNHRPEVVSGVRAEESTQLLRTFFAGHRNI